MYGQITSIYVYNLSQNRSGLQPYRSNIELKSIIYYGIGLTKWRYVIVVNIIVDRIIL